VKWFGLVGADKQSMQGSDGSGARLRMTGKGNLMRMAMIDEIG